MLDLIPLLLGLGLLIACAAWRPSRRAWVWWILLFAGLFVFAAGIAKWQLDATHFGPDVYAIWAGRALFALGIIIAIRLYLARRERRQSGRPRWTVARSFTAAVVLFALFAAAWITGSIPWVRRDGPWAAMPTTLLIAGMDGLPVGAEEELIARLPDRSERFTATAWTRLSRPPMWTWQLSSVHSRFAARMSADPNAGAIRAAYVLAVRLDHREYSDRMWDLSYRGLASPDFEAREQAADVLRGSFRFGRGWFRDSKSYLSRHGADLLSGLIAALSDPRPAVQRAAADAIGEMGPDASIAAPNLIRLVTSTLHADAAFGAWYALEEIKVEPGPVLEYFRVALDSPDSQARRAMLRRMHGFRFLMTDSRIRERMLDILRNADVEESLLSAAAVQEWLEWSREPTTWLDAIVQESISRTNPAYVELLGPGELRDVSEDKLQGLLTASVATLRERAVSVLLSNLKYEPGDHRHRNAKSILTEAAATHPDAAIRAAAANALAPLQTPAGSE